MQMDSQALILKSLRSERLQYVKKLPKFHKTLTEVVQSFNVYAQRRTPSFGCFLFIEL